MSMIIQALHTITDRGCIVAGEVRRGVRRGAGIDRGGSSVAGGGSPPGRGGGEGGGGTHLAGRAEYAQQV